jgi:uncharacterized membrane protein SpoIIM required for sporulation
MKETDFIKQNKKKWARFEKLSMNKNNDPDEVSRLFTEITEDLSYARTFYPRRSVRVYLNQLSQRVFTSLYKQRKQPIGSFIKFWKETVPLEMYRARYNLLVAFLFFLLAAVVGAISTEYDENFVRLILGDYYVEMTEANIEAGKPMDVYGDSPEGSMFFQITFNNIRVAFFAFVLGIFFTLGTFWLLLRNGIMLGAFQWWFKAKGLLFTTFLTIWIHGAFEISAIVIAGAAGLTVGNGIIFPRSYSRAQSLIFAARRGLTILLSLVPVFIMAGMLESFVTRHYQDMHTAVKLGIILVSFGLIIAYYVVYPFIVARRYPEKIAVKEIPRFIPKKKLNWFKIRKPGEIFTDTFTLLIGKISKLSSIFFKLILPIAIILTAIIFVYDWSRFNHSYVWFDTFGTLFGTGRDFEWYKLLAWPIPLTMLIAAGFFVMKDEEEDHLIARFLGMLVKHFIWLYLYALMLFAIFLFTPGLILVFAALLAPFLNMIPAIIIYEKTNFFNAFVRCFDLGKGGYGDGLVTFMALTAITVIFFFLLHNPLEISIIYIIDDLIKEAIITFTPYYAVVIEGVNIFFYFLYFFLVIPIAMISIGVSYHSVEERKTAKGLYNRLENFGKRNRNFETKLDFE